MANIYFKKLSLSNFMSYEKAEVCLNKQGNILVGGINNNPDDNAKSNGCGKSSLFSALSWCLTGETVSGAKDVANIYINGKTEVSVSFDIDNVNYEITRTKNPSNLFIYINGENKSGKGIRDTEKLLVEYIPQLSSSLLNSVIILGQGLPQRFTNNTPAGRKEVLEKLSNSDFMIMDLKEKLSSRKSELSAQQRTLQDDNLSLETSIKINNDSVDKFKSELTSIDNKDTLIKLRDDLELELEDLNLKLDEYKEFDISLHDLLNEKQTELNDLSLEYDTSLNNVEQIDTTLKEKELVDIKSDFKSLKNKINELENIVDICPTCGQKLPNVSKIDTTSLHLELNEKSDTISQLEREIADIQLINSNNIKECKAKFENKLSDLRLDIDTISEDISYNSDKLSQINSNISNVDKKLINITNQIDNLEENIKYRQSKIQELTILNEKLSDKVYNNNEQLAIINDRININSKMQTLVKRDFRGYLLNNVITFIEKRAKIYSSEVFGTDKLTFELANNNIDISYDGKDYSVLSGGEKQKLDIIVQFAIRDMLCTFLNFSSNILVLDEITDSLDSVGVSKVFELINNYLNDVEAVYIISHHTDELEIPADDEIIIIKGDDKLSRIV